MRTLFSIAGVLSIALSLTKMLSGAAPQSPFISQLIASAEAKIKAAPDNADAHGELAFALARKARETEDPAYWERAEQAIATALKLKPGQFEARKSRVLIRLQQGRYADAQEEGRALNKQTPDDNPLYGYLSEAALGTGRYPEAEALTQRMLDLRQVNAPGLQRAAQVREAIGFPEGAIEFWNSALRLTSTTDIEERAHILTEMASLSRRRAKFADAQRYVTDALALEPDYPPALLEKARIALEDKKPDLAITALKIRLLQGASLPAQYWLAEALGFAGKPEEAAAAGKQFESLAGVTGPAPKHRDELLARYWTGQGRAREAVALIQKHAAAGFDFELADAYSLALLANGNSTEAEAVLRRVLDAGIQSPQLFFHAAKIARANHNSEAARTLLKKCIEANASSPYADAAIQELQNPGVAVLH